VSENERVKRRLDKEKLLLSVGIGLGLAFIVLGFRSASTGRDAQRLPDVIESISPGPGDQVLLQSQVFVDFAEGYEATLIIDGIELETTRLDQLSSSGAQPKPGAQVEIPPTALYDPGNYTISYLPQKGGVIESFSQGKHTAAVRYWKIVDGPTKARQFTWEFETN